MGGNIGGCHVLACDPMSYRNYVIAAYCVFVIVLAWDFVVPRIQRRALLRAAKLRVARNTSPAASELNQ
jgi:heme exporter protein D